MTTAPLLGTGSLESRASHILPCFFQNSGRCLYFTDEETGPERLDGLPKVTILSGCVGLSQALACAPRCLCGEVACRCLPVLLVTVLIGGSSLCDFEMSKRLCGRIEKEVALGLA